MYKEVKQVAGTLKLVADIPAELKEDFAKVAKSKNKTMTMLVKEYVEEEVRKYNQSK